MARPSTQLDAIATANRIGALTVDLAQGGSVDGDHPARRLDDGIRAVPDLQFQTVNRIECDDRYDVDAASSVMSSALTAPRSILRMIPGSTLRALSFIVSSFSEGLPPGRRRARAGTIIQRPAAGNHHGGTEDPHMSSCAGPPGGQSGRGPWPAARRSDASED